MRANAPQLQVSEKQATILQKLIRRSQSPQSLVTRSKIVLGGAQYGRRNQQIARELGISNQTVKTWRGRWLELSGILSIVEEEKGEQELEQAIIQLLADQP
jgi:DNA-binding NarL/FixJ family response regulator